MKASKVMKLYLWAEVLFMGYLLVKPKSPGKPDALDDLKDNLKETLKNGPQDP